MRAALVVVLVGVMAGAAHADVTVCGSPTGWADRSAPHLEGPPPSPQPSVLDLELDDRQLVVTFVGELASDAILELDIQRAGQDPGEPLSIDVMPSVESVRGYRTCRVAIPGLADGDHVHVQMTAIRRGMTSASTPYETDVHAFHFRCGMPFIGMFVFMGGALLLAVVVLLVWLLVRSATRARRIANAAPEPISLLVVEKLARRHQFRTGLGAALCAAAVAALVRTSPLEVFAVAPLLLGLIDLHAYLAARAIVGMLGEDARAEVKHCQLVVHASGRIRQLEVSPRALARAQRNAVPRSTVT